MPDIRGPWKDNAFQGSFLDHIFPERKRDLYIVKEIGGETLKTENKTFNFLISQLKDVKYRIIIEGCQLNYDIC